MFGKIGLGRLLDSKCVGAKVDLVAIGFENFIFGIMLLHLAGEEQFFNFSAPASFKRKIEVLCQLLGNAAAAARAPEQYEVVDQGSNQSFLVQSMMMIKFGILHCQDGVDEVLRDLGQFHFFPVGEHNYQLARIRINFCWRA